MLERQGGATLKGRIRQRRQPTEQGGQLATHLHARAMPVHQACRTLKILGQEGVINCLSKQAVRFEPGACPPVERLDLGQTDFASQAVAQEVGKEVMIAIPVAPAVKRHQKEIGMFEMGQDFLPRSREVRLWISLMAELSFAGFRLVCLGAHDGVTQGTTQPVQDSGVQQKALDRRRLLLQHFLGEIVKDIVMAAGKVADKARNTGPIQPL
jgi:hypothetical protein